MFILHCNFYLQCETLQDDSEREETTNSDQVADTYMQIPLKCLCQMRDNSNKFYNHTIRSSNNCLGKVSVLEKTQLQKIND